MASIRSSSHRRRSRSASNSSIVCRSPDSSFRIATKRAYPIQPSASHKWDVDAWRRGKRRRCDVSPPNIGMDFPPPPREHNTPHTITPPRFTFSTSSTDFNIFPSSSRRRASYSSPGLADAPANVPTPVDSARLRSSAFWELHRSVAESGEGFVQRMRDYERVRTFQFSEPTRRGRKRASHPQTIRAASYIPDSDESDNDDDDNDDIHIFSGELSPNPSSRFSHHGKRAASMDVACHNQRPSEAGYTGVFRHSPRNLPSSSPSSDSDGPTLPMNLGPLLSPSLLSLSSTAPSSLSSPIQSQHLDVDECSIISFPPLSLPTSTSSADHTFVSSDKAVADLSLAFANGAGGINDYDYLENLSTFQPMDGGEPGELWH